MTDGINLGSAFAQIDLDTSPLQRGVRDVQRPLRALDQSLSQTGRAAEQSSRMLNLPAQSFDRIGTSADQIVRDLRQSSNELRATGDAAQRAGGNMTGLNTSTGALDGTMRGMIGTVGGLAAAYVGLEQVITRVADGFQLASALEAQERQLGTLIGSQQRANQIFGEATEFAERYAFTQREMGVALQGLAPLINQSNASLDEQLSVLARLAQLNPAEGLEGAAFSLRELASGDITSIVERFNLSRQEVTALRDEIRAGGDTFVLMSEYLNDIGASAELLENRTQGTQGAMNELTRANERLNLALGELAASGGGGAIGAVTDALDDLSTILESSAVLMDEFGGIIDTSFANITSAIGLQQQQVEQLQSAWSALLGVLPGPGSLGRTADLMSDLTGRLGITDDVSNKLAKTQEYFSSTLGDTADAAEGAADSIAEIEGADLSALGDLARAAQDAYNDIDALDADFQAGRQERAQEFGARLGEIESDRVDAVNDYYAELTSIDNELATERQNIAIGLSDDLQDIEENRAREIGEIQRDLADTRESIERETQERTLELVERYAEERAAAERRVANETARSLADFRADMQADDLDLVGADPEDQDALRFREDAQHEQLRRLEAAQAEARELAARGEGEQAEEVFGIREQAIEQQLALDEQFNRRRRELLESGQGNLLPVLQQQYEEAQSAIRDSEQVQIDIAAAAAETRAQEREQERQAILEDAAAKQQAAEEAAATQIAAANEAATIQKQAAQQQAAAAIAAAQQQARIERESAQERLQEEQRALNDRATQEQQAFRDQATEAQQAYQQQRSDLTAALGDRLTEYVNHYGEVYGLTQAELSRITSEIQQQYGTQTTQVTQSLQQQLQAWVKLENDQGQIIANTSDQTRQLATATQSATNAAAQSLSAYASNVGETFGYINKQIDRYVQRISNLPTVGTRGGGNNQQPPGRASGGPVAAGQPYMVGELGREIVIPTGNGTVLPNDVTERIMSTTNSPTINAPITITLSGNIDSPARAQAYGAQMAAIIDQRVSETITSTLDRVFLANGDV